MNIHLPKTKTVEMVHSINKSVEVETKRKLFNWTKHLIICLVIFLKQFEHSQHFIKTYFETD